MTGRNLSTPSRRKTKEELSEDDPFLTSSNSTLYRALVARGNYLAQDRTAIRFAVKELARSMAKPKMSDWEALIHFAR